MTYEQFKELVDTRLEAIGREYGELIVFDMDWQDPFSYLPCDVCGRHEAGERYRLTAMRPGDAFNIHDLTVCTDCLLYVETGQVDDFRE